MRLKPFKKEKLTNKQKKILIALSSLCFIFLFIAIYQSFAAYNIKHSETIVDAKVGSMYDIRVLAIYLDGEHQPNMTTFPTDNAFFTHVRCYVEGEFRENIIGIWENDSLEISGFTSKTDCNVYFVSTIRNFAYIAPTADNPNPFQTFTVPSTGEYQIELWGAQGRGNNGGYVRGRINLNAGQVLYIYVGGQGFHNRAGTIPGGWNGGGNAWGNPDGNNNSGGGATDVRLTAGDWNDTNSLRNRIMVAGGGGGFVVDAGYTQFGAAGGVTGIACLSSFFGNANGGTQTAGGTAAFGTHSPPSGVTVQGSFGQGANGMPGNNRSGGGGGYYGGGSLMYCAGGGSSFISGHAGSNAVNAAGTHLNSPNHPSGKIFTNTIMIDGAGFRWTNVRGAQQQMPNPAGGFYALGEGNFGHGHARITRVG